MPPRSSSMSTAQWGQATLGSPRPYANSGHSSTGQGVAKIYSSVFIDNNRENMPNSGIMDKRKVRDEKAGESANKANVNRNILIDNYHGYATKEGMKISVMDEDDFPDLPVTPTKPPPSKKGKKQKKKSDTKNADRFTEGGYERKN
ncbi:Hypothetical predicted protein [Scomber scombrus]|uniref:Uncharacterized protein n=1 Tax=Scomber scombrus TaxID=13677 RepID=A0AAV1QGB4_SCOSC